MTFWRWKMVWRSEGCTHGDKLLWGPAPLYLQNCQVWKKTPYMPHYQPIIPSCLVKLKRGLNPDLTGVIKLIFFFFLLKERSWMLNTGIFVFLKTALLLCVQIPSLCVCGVWVFFLLIFRQMTKACRKGMQKCQA